MFFFLVISCHHRDQQNQGQEAYERYCALCHGEQGEGYVAPQANALSNPEFLAAATDDFIEYATIYGRPETKMSSWGTSAGGPIEDNIIYDITTYIRSWQTLPSADIHNMEIFGDSENGQTLYEQYCVSCHGERGEGTSALSINNPTFLESVSDGFLFHALSEGRSNTTMMSYSGILTDLEIHDIIAFIRLWENDM